MVDEREKKESKGSKVEIPSAKASNEERKIMAQVGDVLLSIIAAVKCTQLYPETNPSIQRAIKKVKQKLSTFASDQDLLNITIRKNSIIFQSKAVLPKKNDVSKLALKLYFLHIQQISFNPQISEQEIRDLIYLLGQKNEQIKKEGGFLALLESRNIENIMAKSAKKVKIFREETTEEIEAKEIEAEGIEPEEMEDLEHRLRDFNNNINFFQNIFLSVSHIESHHRNMLLGMLDEPTGFADILLNISTQVIPLKGQSKIEAQVEFIYNAINNLGEYIQELDPMEQEMLFRKLSNAILSLKDELKEDLIQHKMLPQMRRGSLEAKILSYFPAIDLASALTTKLKLHSGVSSIIYDTLDNLTIAKGKRNSIMELIRQKIALDERYRGQYDELFKDIISPPRPQIQEKEKKPMEFPDVSFEFGPEDSSYVESKVQEFKEASKEKDLLYTLLELLPLVENYTSFGAIIDKIEEKIELLIPQPDLDLLVKITSALKAEGEKRKASSQDFQERINLAFEAFSNLELIDNLLNFAVGDRQDSREFQQIRQFMDNLGRFGAESLLNHLIKEESMGVRKKIIQLLIALGKDYLELLGKNINHEEWFVVRNIVHILGRYGPEAIPYLQRVANHPDFRVKKELIISLALIQSEEAINLLISFLQDKDSRIREIAIAQLGLLSAPQSIAYLINILKQKEQVFKNPDIILAVIKALSQMGAEESLPQLRNFSKYRWIIWRFWQVSAWHIRRHARIAIKLIERKRNRM